MRALAACVVVLSLGACVTPVNPVTQASLLLARDREFSRTSEQLGAGEAFRRFLAPTAVNLPDGKHPIRGRDAIVASLAKIRGETVLRWFPVEALVGGGGDLGYTWGNWELVKRTGGVDVIVSRGKYVSIWRRAGGRWQVILDAGNDAPGQDMKVPAPASTAPGKGFP